ncbi:MAG: DUF4261 domain-containing protein [Rubripirellula sp.]
MAKGLFTQGICVLLREPIALAELEERLQSLEFAGRHESMDDDDSPQTLVYEYRPEVNGHLLITPSSGRWPDDMGDPDETPERFIAWSLGQFGPLAFPGCLERAGEQSWGWEAGGDLIESHQAHIRLLISYVLGTDDPDEEEDDLPLVPDEYDSLHELTFLMRAVSSLLEMPEAICYFNPGGEVLRDDDGLRRGLNYAWNHDLPPLDMWTNVRLFRATDNWSLMDTVGNGQFDLPDLEAVYETEKYEPSQVEGFLRSASLYLLHDQKEIEDGDTADGPGDLVWQALECYDALSDPPRPTIRWIPDDGTEPPSALLDRGEEPPEIEEDFFEDDEEDDDGFGEDETEDFDRA